MFSKVFWTFFALILIVGTFFVFFHEKEVKKKTRFNVAVINPNKGMKLIDELFIQGLEDYGSKEGWQFDFQRCKDKKTLEKDIKKILSSQPDLLFTVTTPGTKKAIKESHGKNIPGVFVLFDPVYSGIIKTLTHPGGNFTGIQLRGSVPKALEWLLAVAPDTKHLFVPVKFDTEATRMSLADLVINAKYLGIQVTSAEVNSKEELDKAIASIPDEIDAIFLVNSIFISTNAGRINEVAVKKKLPIASSMGKCSEGITITYSPQHSQISKQATRLAYEIIKGNNPGDIPSEMVDFYLCVNLQAANEIGLHIPDTVLAQADEIIR